MAKCIDCEKKILEVNSISIYKKGTNYADQDEISKKAICEKCLCVSDQFAYCMLCGEEGAFYISDLKSDGFSYYCKEHKGEILDEEESEYWLDYSDYINDPNH